MRGGVIPSTARNPVVVLVFHPPAIPWRHLRAPAAAAAPRSRNPASPPLPLSSSTLVIEDPVSLSLVFVFSFVPPHPMAPPQGACGRSCAPVPKSRKPLSPSVIPDLIRDPGSLSFAFSSLRHPRPDLDLLGHSDKITPDSRTIRSFDFVHDASLPCLCGVEQSGSSLGSILWGVDPLVACESERSLLTMNGLCRKKLLYDHLSNSGKPVAG